MKKLTIALLGLSLLCPAITRATDFEGVVTMSLTGVRERTMPMTFSIKPGFTRIDMDAAGGRFGGMIMDQKKEEMMILLPQQHMYMVQPIPQQAVNEAAHKINDADVEKTDAHEKILGYDTTKYVAKTNEGTSEIWITDQLGTFQGIGTNRPIGPFGRPGAGAGGAGHSWEKAFKGKDAFPLRVVTTDADGKQTFKMEATKIDKKSLPDSTFAPPAGFRKFDMGAMMQGMGMPGGLPGNMPQRGSTDE